MSRNVAFVIVVLAAGLAGSTGLSWTAPSPVDADPDGVVSQAALMTRRERMVEQPVPHRRLWPAAEQPAESALPTIDITGPTVIAFWKSPTSNAELAADPGLAAALDQQQYYWAETRERLSALGVAALGQPGQRFLVREDQTERLFSAPPDSAVIGYLLVRPGGEFRTLYRLYFPDQILDEVRTFFELDERPE